MQNPPPSSSPPPPPLPPVLDMDSIDESSSSIWDWSQLLDFSIEDHLYLPTEESHPSSEIPTSNELHPVDHPPVEPLPDSFPVNSNSSNNDRVRKRDPRMVCSNFLAGRIPCACPELDAILAEEEEAAAPGKKRTKMITARAGARCQVPGCEVDISELKGYHKRHKVCLRCANASDVLLDGQNKRYCQQCGKFHVLSDFDKGRRSCRRKLERHNKRRRRKPSDSNGSGEGKLQSAEDDCCDDEAGKGTNCMSSEAAEGEKLLLAAEGHNTLTCSTQAQNIQSDSIMYFAASGETQTDEEKEKFPCSPSDCVDKSAFSSVCPTGRISFKLYDWNPAEFPRRLRHQIFQWLASMPVELEGYIRPGCIILTFFVALPRFMWVKLSEDPVVCIHDLLASPRNMLSGRETFYVHLNNMMFSVMKDEMSVIKVKVAEQVPKLHYVHPTCFVAGKPIELSACGSNLIQPRFRFLVSFAGKYLKNDVRLSPLLNKTDNSATDFDHQLLNICVPHTELDVFGPGFIEVENESGLSNFIPILIADEEICTEIKIMQIKFYSTLHSRDSQSFHPCISCEVAVLRQNKFSELLLDMAWLLREPVLEDMGYATISTQLQRFTCVLNFLIEYESTTVLQRVLHWAKMRINGHIPTGIVEADERTLFEGTVRNATQVLRQRLEKNVNLVVRPIDLFPKRDDQCNREKLLPIIPTTNQNVRVTEIEVGALESAHKIETIPLLNAECMMGVRAKSFNHIMFAKTSKFLTSRPFIFVIASAVVCFGVCAVVLNPHEATTISTTIRRCLF